MEMRFSDDFIKVLEFSRDEAVRTGWHNICPDHIMLGALRLGCLDGILLDAGISGDAFKASLDDALFVSDAIPWEERDSILLCDSARSFLEHSALEARRCGSSTVTPLHYLLAVCRVSGPYCHDYLEDNGVSLRTIVEASGMAWEEYGFGRAQVSPAAAAPDPILLAEAIERRLREGYTTGDQPAS